MYERPFRFLFLHSETGGGHRRGAQAAARALTVRYGELAHVEVIDAAVSYAPPPFCRLPSWYNAMLWGDGRAYSLGFCLLDRRRRAEQLSRAIWPTVRQATARLLERHPADLVVAFHPLLVHPLARQLDQMACPPPLIGVSTDLVVMHAFWADRRVQRYLVATEQARDRLVRHAVDPARVEVTGLPVDPRLEQVAAEDPSGLRRRLGVDSARPLVLIMSGSGGVGPLEQLTRAIVDAGPQLQVTVITGQNHRLRERLAQIEWDLPVRVEGLVDNVHEWMRAADLLVARGGPNTIAEALCLGLPLVIWGAIPEQETPNAQLVVERGAGVWAPGPRRAAAEVRRLLNDPAATACMSAAGHALAPHGAADRVAQALWRSVVIMARSRNVAFQGKDDALTNKPPLLATP